MTKRKGILHDTRPTLAVQILDTMDLMTEALVELSRELSAGNTTAAFDLSCGLREMAARVCNLAPGLCAEEPELDLDKTSVSVYESIKALSCLSPDPDPTLHKIEFETLPLLLNMKLRFISSRASTPIRNVWNNITAKKCPIFLKTGIWRKLPRREIQIRRQCFDFSI